MCLRPCSTRSPRATTHRSVVARDQRGLVIHGGVPAPTATRAVSICARLGMQPCSELVFVEEHFVYVVLGCALRVGSWIESTRFACALLR